MRIMILSLIFIFGSTLATAAVPSNEASLLIEKSENHTRGKSFQATAKMTVNKGGSERTLTLKIWTSGKDKALIKILTPKKDHGTGNLRLDFNLWQYLPNVDRVIKIPSSLMLQSWMGSDFTNDDLVRSSSLSRDYTHQIIGREVLAGMKSVKILCTPKKDAPVVWGKIIVWVREGDGVPIKHQYYSESGELLKLLVGSNFHAYGSHIIPTVLTMKNVKSSSSTTTISYDPKTIVYDRNIDSDVFTQQNLQRPPDSD